MVTTSIWFSLLFLPRVFATILVSDVYWGQGECDTSVDPFKNKKGETPCTVVLELLVPCNVNVTESSTAEINASACACNLEFYNILSACAWFCVKQFVDPLYTWSENCNQIVPLTTNYPFASAITTDIPSWASERLSSNGDFDPSTVTRGGWTTVQKLTPVIVGLSVLILAGLIWCLHRTHRRRRSLRRAQGTNGYLGHHRNGSSLSYSSTSHLNAQSPGQQRLPVHRIRFFFRGMFPVRERHKSSDWNIEGESVHSRRSSVAYDPPPDRESGSFSTSMPIDHAQNDTPPTSPAVTWSPFQTISRWWTSVGPSGGKDYQSVHLLPTRKNSKFGADDEDHPDAAFASPSHRNQASNSRNDRTSEEEVPPDGERERLSPPRTPRPETEPLGSKRSRPPSLRPNRPGHIVAVPSSSRPLTTADAPTTTMTSSDPSPFPAPPEVQPQVSTDTFHTSHTTLPTDETEQTARPRALGPEHLFPPSVRAAGYTVPERPEDPVVRAWIRRPNGTANRPATNIDTEPPSYNQVNNPAPTLPRPLSPTSLHPYPYTNHLRSTADVTVLGGSRSPHRHPHDLDTTDTHDGTVWSRLSLAVNESTSAPPSEDGSVDGDTDFTPISNVHGSDSLKNLEYTPYPSSALLPISAAGTPRVDHLPSSRR